MATLTAADHVRELALEQHGIIRAQQVTALGYTPDAVVQMARRGRLRRLAHGLYQDVRAPEDRWTRYMAATLWPHRTIGLLGRETVLSLLDLSDVNPGVIHVLVPPAHRVRHRRPPPGVVFIHADVPPDERTAIEGVPATTVARAIRDCAAAHLGPALLRQAIQDAHRTGWITDAEAQQLTDDLQQSGSL